MWFRCSGETVRDLESQLDAARHQLMKPPHQQPSQAVSAASSTSSLKDANFDGTH